ncbi:tyrosine-type recombinase/integrase [Natranaerobius thermophilus]|uniref:Integrase family protein n=1 Tax=Natranaerobius thermophilus (strain ATCC BAA-1301 / DSM 18059 / JW/NM-WN-LF) TaxID=457570 RepID=B2A1F4_NATTJ|nr:site-specific integrase [Natranaerobius thermophilus]ACB84694.1 integrase family protein [Natranaerobius thermophilus JW/NM-WN-LF]
MPQTVPVALNREEQNSLLRVPERNTVMGLRDLIIMNLILNYGLRLYELRSLRWDNLDLHANMIYIPKSKGSFGRKLQLRLADYKLLNTWKDTQNQYFSTSYVITTLSGNVISGSYIESILQRYSQKAGISKRLTPHILRHVFAVDSYKKTGDLDKVQELLGHRFRSTTEEYLKIVDTRVSPSKLKWLKI